MSGDVKNNRTAHRYELVVDGVIAFAEYERNGSVVTMTHTVVPEELGGKGVGGRLAVGALDDIRAQGFTVVPQCPFIAKFIEKHPDYQSLVAP